MVSEDLTATELLYNISNLHFFFCYKDSDPISPLTTGRPTQDEWKFREEMAEFVERFGDEIKEFIAHNNLQIRVNKWPLESEFPNQPGWLEAGETYEDIRGITVENAQVEILAGHIMNSSKLDELGFVVFARERGYLVECDQHKHIHDVPSVFNFLFPSQRRNALDLYKWPIAHAEAILCHKAFGLTFSRSLSDVLAVVAASKKLLEQHKSNLSVLDLFEYKKQEIATCCAPLASKRFLPKEELLEAATTAVAAKVRRWNDLPSRLANVLDPEKLASLGLAHLGALSASGDNRRIRADGSPLNDGTEFERFIGGLLRSNGFDFEFTPQTGDFGADIIATSKNLKCAIQCKDHRLPIGVNAIQEIFAAKAFYRCDSAVCISRNGFTDQAISMALSLNVLIYTAAELSGEKAWQKLKGGVAHS